MKKIIFLLVILSSLSFILFAEDHNITISTFSISGENSDAALEDFLIDLFTVELITYPNINLLERRLMEQVLNAQEFSLSDLVDSDTSIRIGSLIGTGYIFTGDLRCLSDFSYLSVRLINNTTGEVIFASMTKINDEPWETLPYAVNEVSYELAAKLGSETDINPSALWITGTDYGQEIDRAGKAEDSILIYIMSNVEDSEERGTTWYLGPEQIQTITNVLKENNFSVEVHDRRSLASISDIDLDGYSQVWIIETDTNGIIDTTESEAQKLYTYFNNGGSIWLSGETGVMITDMGDMTEDVNVLAEPFGIQIKDFIVVVEQPQRISNPNHPVLRGVENIIFDKEIGRLEITNNDVEPIFFINRRSRILSREMTSIDFLRLGDQERIQEWFNGRQDWSFEWLFGNNFRSIGPIIGPDFSGIAVLDKSDSDKGKLIIDSGWLIGWTFNGPSEEMSSVGDNIIFIKNTANWLEDK